MNRFQKYACIGRTLVEKKAEVVIMVVVEEATVAEGVQVDSILPNTSSL
jgi:hypothetical protein